MRLTFCLRVCTKALCCFSYLHQALVQRYSSYNSLEVACTEYSEGVSRQPGGHYAFEREKD